MTREEIRQRAAGIWIPFSRIGATAGILGILAMGAKLVQIGTQMQDELRTIADSQLTMRHALTAQQDAESALDNRMGRAEVRIDINDRRITALEARRP